MNLQIKNSGLNERILSIDAIRGIAIIFMALDHTREFLLASNVEATDIVHASFWLFITRFITNFCAPVFVLLVGTSMNLAIQNGKSKSYIAKFLVTRGIWLCLTEFTIVHFVWTFELIPSVVDLQTMYALGISMIILSFFIFLPNLITLMIGIIIIISHNLLDSKDAELLGNLKFIHLSYITQITPGFKIWFDYPIIPWIGVALVGYVMGDLWKYLPKVRKKIFLSCGLSLSALFIVLRLYNLYGEANIWVAYDTIAKTTASFLNLSKYPPSLMYLLITIGPAFIVFYFFENKRNKFIELLSVFGRVPFFFYVTHIFIIHCLAIIIGYIRNKDITVYFNINIYDFFGQPQYLLSSGIPSLGLIYLSWAVLLGVMYQLSKRYGKFKSNHKSSIILSYL